MVRRFKFIYEMEFSSFGCLLDAVLAFRHVRSTVSGQYLAAVLSVLTRLSVYSAIQFSKGQQLSWVAR